MSSLTGTRTLITGVTSKIGSALAARIVASGGEVVGISTNTEELRELEYQLEGGIITGCADVVNPGVIPAIADLGVIDTVVCLSENNLVLEPDAVACARLLDTMSTHISGITNTVNGAIGGMKSRGSGLIIIVDSLPLFSLSTLWGAAVYGWRTVVDALVQSWRREYLDQGINALLIAPTPGTETTADGVADRIMGAILAGTSPVSALVEVSSPVKKRSRKTAARAA